MEERKELDETALRMLQLFKHVTAKKFVSYLKDMGVVELRCPICGGNDIAMPVIGHVSIEEGMFLRPTRMKPIGLDLDEILDNYSYRLLCKKCSHEIYFNCYPIVGYFLEKEGLEKLKELRGE
ncbi:hypothetical protein U8233_002898 [Providencia rettgeri]|nr:hypothetical protein [Providencia rettgeri]